MKKITLLLTFLAVSSVCWGADALQSLPDAPEPQSAANAKFWTLDQTAETGAFAGAIAIDCFYTHQGELTGRFTENNPLARPLVSRGTAGQVAAGVIGFGTIVGASYLLHRSGHPEAARWLMRGALAIEGVNAAIMTASPRH